MVGRNFIHLFFERKEMHRLVLFIVILLCVTSCITNKQTQYLQKDDVNKKDLVKDSVLRTYDLTLFDYKVQPNDLLYIRFSSLTPEEFDFFQKASPQSGVGALGQGGAGALLIGELVDPEGTVPFPVVGKVKVAGMTIFEVQDSLQLLADQYLESPVVKVRLLNYRVTVLGEVNGEQTVVLGNNRVSFLEAIGHAGGLGEYADRSNIKVIRQKGDRTEVFYVDLLKENFLESDHYYVNQNDIIIVPPLKQKPFRKYFGQNLGLLASTITLLLLAINLIN